MLELFAYPSLLDQTGSPRRYLIFQVTFNELDEPTSQEWEADTHAHSFIAPLAWQPTEYR